jgi:hypothetical protein
MKDRWNGRLLLALLIMFGYLWEHHRLASMDETFFIRSPGGIRALGLYLAGDYAVAGRAYSALVPSSAPMSTRRSTGDALGIDRLLAAVLRDARAGETGRSVRTMHRVLWLDAEIRGSSTSLFEIVTFTGDALQVPPARRNTALLATMHAYLRRYDVAHEATALEYAREALARGELVPETYVTLSILQADAGELAESRASVNRALAMDPQHPSALVWAAVQAGRRHDILAEHRFLRAAWTATSHDPGVGEALERLLTKLGDAHGLDALRRDRLADRAATTRD